MSVARNGKAEAARVVCVRAAEEDYLWDGLYETDAIISSLDLNQAVTEIIPVVFPLAKKRRLLFLVELIKHTPAHYSIATRIMQ